MRLESSVLNGASVLSSCDTVVVFRCALAALTNRSCDRDFDADFKGVGVRARDEINN